MSDSIKAKQAARLIVLNSAYECGEGNTAKQINIGALQQESAISSDEELLNHVEYLINEGLLKATVRLGGGVPAFLSLTHKAIKEIESLQTTPEKPTEHFPFGNVLYVQNLVNSNVQVGTTNSTQIYKAFPTEKLVALQEFIDSATQLIKKQTGDASVWEEVNAEIETLRAQSKSPRPKVSILKECLASVIRICEGTVGGAAGTLLASNATTLLAGISALT
jgi:hypothetical protein